MHLKKQSIAARPDGNVKQLSCPSTLVRNFLLVLLASWFIHPQVRSQEPTENRYFRNGPGVVLLKNGEVINGDVRSFDNTLQILLDDTGSVSLPSAQVAYVGVNLNDVYNHQFRSVKRWTVGDHFQLARWCLKNKLFDAAMSHYQYLQTEIPDRPEFKQFDMELRVAILAEPSFREALIAAGVLPPDAPEKAGAESAGANPPEQAAAGNQAGMTDEERSSLASSKAAAIVRLSANDQNIFAHDIQPVLSNSCARAACHGAFGSTRFNLLDSRNMDLRVAMKQNLQTFSTYIMHHKGAADSSPENHPLFTKSVAAHGQLINDPLDVTNVQHQRYIEQLRLWIARANSAPELNSSELATSSRIASAPHFWSNSPIVDSGSIASSSNQPASFVAPTFREPMSLESTPRRAGQPLSPNQPMLAGNEIESLAKAISRMEEIEKNRAEKKDPFDPDEFNSQFSNTETK